MPWPARRPTSTTALPGLPMMGAGGGSQGSTGLARREKTSPHWPASLRPWAMYLATEMHLRLGTKGSPSTPMIRANGLTRLGSFPTAGGQVNIYLSAIDAQMKHPSDAPTIGLILCKTRDRITAEYALRISPSQSVSPSGKRNWFIPCPNR